MQWFAYWRHKHYSYELGWITEGDVSASGVQTLGAPRHSNQGGTHVIKLGTGALKIILPDQLPIQINCT